ncbi:heterokaryon incompatibility protein-domain-containing protein [Xylaria grammica]|nr:heterokaryon incompatibility protein-domain-containing protein [Xylaria grammica]
MDLTQEPRPSPYNIAVTVWREAILCTSCLSLLPPAWIRDGKDGHLIKHSQDRSYQDLEDSSRAGCGFCGSLLNIVSRRNLPLNNHHRDLHLRLSTGSILGQIGIYEGSFNAPDRIYDIMIDLDHQDQAGFVGAHSLSERSLAFISKNLRQCKETHRECVKLEGHLPKRVLFVGSKSDNTIKLIERSQERAHYICLSHCWGNTESIKTTNENIAYHKIGIQWNDLPRVYRDAITFCRELKVQYVWIDSLCIKQDDEDDWVEESSKMASIYENSYLTLAATSARNHDEACASQLSPTHHFNEVGKIHLKNLSRSFPVLLRRSLPHPYNEDEMPWAEEKIRLDALRAFTEQNKTKFPLLMRAWVYQERLLPSRVLHFLPDELMWECKEGVECQCQCITPKSTVSQEFIETKQFRTLGRKAMSLMHCTACQRFRIWGEILQGYAELELSFSKDRLPAISGLASKVQGDEDRYLAGLWESTLPDALFWRRDLSNMVMPQTLPRPEPTAAPTWSWASISSARLYSYGYQCRKCHTEKANAFSPRVEGVDVQPATANPYGTVNANATLVISGTLSSGILHFRQRRPFFVIPGTTTEFEFEPDYSLEHPGQYHVSQGTSLVCLYREYDQTEDPKENSTNGLIFRGLGEGLGYERIGYAPFHRIDPKESAVMHSGTLRLV